MNTTEKLARNCRYINTAILILFGLYLLAMQPAEGVEVRTGGHLPMFVWGSFAFYFGTGALIIFAALRELRRWKRSDQTITAPRTQIAIWALICISATVVAVTTSPLPGMLCILPALLLPRRSIL